ncbi:MAG TPA: hypothetical protein VHB99_12705 [Pirellulales bacterium]|nr:hypothetical protein [Pirellulales bacterium]
MDEKRTDDRWQRLLDKTRRGPLGSIKQGPFLSRPTLCSRRGFVSIVQSRGLRWFGAVAIPLFVLPIYLGIWTPDFFIDAEAGGAKMSLSDTLFVIGLLAFFYALTACALIVPQVSLIRQRRLRWETIGRDVTIEWGFLFNPQSLAFERRELKAVEFSPAIGFYLSTLFIALFFGGGAGALGGGLIVGAVRKVVKSGLSFETLFSANMLAIWLFAAICLSLAGLVLWAATAAILLAPRITIDLDRSEFYSRPSLLNLARWRRRIPLADAAGLQICSQSYDEQTLPRWLPYELNLVLRRPAAERITLIDARGREKIGRLAGELGEFLGLPVWDHSRPGGQEPLDERGHGVANGKAQSTEARRDFPGAGD